MITEFGAEANRNGPVTEKGTYEFQADFLEYHLGVFASKPFINGALIWNLRDFRVKPGWAGGNPLPHPPVNEKGLIDDTGFRKPGFVRGAEGLPQDRARSAKALGRPALRPPVERAERLEQRGAVGGQVIDAGAVGREDPGLAQLRAGAG